MEASFGIRNRAPFGRFRKKSGIEIMACESRGVGRP